MLIGSLSRLGNVFYGIPNLATLLLESVFGQIQGLGLLSWERLIDDAIRPLFLNCPQDMWPTFIPALIPPLLMWLVEHIEWDAIAKLSTVKGGEGRDEESEVSKEAVVRVLFEAIVGMCTDLISPLTHDQKAMVVNSKEMAFTAPTIEQRNAALQKRREFRTFVTERQVSFL
jgi:hypothetical protein